jgi:hypothetical protein
MLILISSVVIDLGGVKDEIGCMGAEENYDLRIISFFLEHSGLSYFTIMSRLSFVYVCLLFVLVLGI